MSYQGQITLSKELTYTQAQKLKEALNNSKPPLCLELTTNGKALQWNGMETIDLARHLHVVITSVISHWNIRAFGVISYRPKKPTLPFDIVVLNNQVKLYREGKITSLSR